MKTRLFFVALTALAAVAAGCSKGVADPDNPVLPPDAADNPPRMTIAQTEYVCGSVQGDPLSIAFEVDAAWEASIEYGDDWGGWLSLSPAKGSSGKHTILVSVAENTEAEPRQATLVIAYGDRVQRIGIVQEGGPTLPEPELELLTDPHFDELSGFESHEMKVTFRTNREWKVVVGSEESPTEWLTVTPSSGSAGVVELTLTLPENPSADDRYTYVSIECTNDWHCASFVVDQNGQNLAYVFDKEFARVLEERGYVKDAGHIPIEEVKGIKQLSLHGGWDAAQEKYLGKLTSLEGIEYFESLEELTCWGNQLTTLAIRHEKLKELWCYSNRLTTLDVSGCPALEVLWCHSNPVGSLDLSHNPALNSAECYNMGLSSLDVSHNPELWFLSIEKNRIATIDVSHNPKLYALDCSKNLLKELDVSNNPEIWQLNVKWNPGDGRTFPIRAWFDESSLPCGDHARFTTESWKYDGREIVPDYRKVK